VTKISVTGRDVTSLEKQPDKVSAIKENVVADVLQNYLDQLLVSGTQPQRIEKAILIPDFDEASPQQAEVIEVPIVAQAETEQVQVELIRASSAVPAEVVKEQEVAPLSNAPSAELENELETGLETESAIESAVEQCSQPLIDQESWSSQGVECLVFSVGGLKLAVPLLFLGGVHEVNASDVKPLIGQPKWYLGMIHRDEQNLQVIDTASFIMPERTKYSAEQGYKYLIQLEKTPWAIACQSIDDTVRLEATEIKWRGDRGKRAWLAGTVIEKMCALIDVSGLLQQVESSCKPI
jgi:purine-binding chemotaxis protein CheW